MKYYILCCLALICNAQFVHPSYPSVQQQSYLDLMQQQIYEQQLSELLWQLELTKSHNEQVLYSEKVARLAHLENKQMMYAITSWVVTLFMAAWASLGLFFYGKHLSRTNNVYFQ